MTVAEIGAETTLSEKKDGGSEPVKKETDPE
jgi:hypothetical protein